MATTRCLCLLLAAFLIYAHMGAVTTQNANFQVNFTPATLQAHMGTQVQVSLAITDIDTKLQNFHFELRSEAPYLAQVNRSILPAEFDAGSRSWHGNISIDALLLGKTRIYVDLQQGATNATPQASSQFLDVIVVRKQRVIDIVFAASVALLVSLLYINFGAAVDLTVMESLIRRPVGPSIGFVSQFVLMPVLSYALGYIIFPDNAEMQLGLFFTGVSPSGGASNIWAVLLGGNINLSLLMTSISNFAAFLMMPLWLFTLGRLIFDRGNMQVPYSSIATYAVCLVVPLAIGIAIQYRAPRLARHLVRLLKPISGCLIAFIIVFATLTNLYLFQLFSWQIVLAGLGLPWLGYIFGWVLAFASRQNAADALTIAIETGVQNTGIAIFLLRFSLPQPEADLTTVIPVAVAIMTPVPLLLLYIVRRLMGRTGAKLDINAIPTEAEESQDQIVHPNYGTQG